MNHREARELLEQVRSTDLSLLDEDGLFEVNKLIKKLEHDINGRYIETSFDTKAVRDSYPKQMQFFKAGKDNKFRMLLGGNRSGKTHCGLTELAYHLCGHYPDWWEGRVFKHPVEFWCISPDHQTSIETIQGGLLGDIDDIGTGFLPRDSIDFDTLRQIKRKGTTIGQFRVKHKSGSYSTVDFKSAEAGREALQGSKKSIYIDEECPMSIYTELVTRSVSPTKYGEENIVMLTFTPLSGVTELIRSFLVDDDVYSEGQVHPHMHLTRVGWKDVPHIDQATIDQMKKIYPPHEHETRMSGIPSIGAGAVYPISEDKYIISPFQIPSYYERGIGFDVGSKTAVVRVARDPETDTYYVYGEHFWEDQPPIIHAEGIISGMKFPEKVCIDYAANASSQTDRKNLFDIYKKKNLNLVNADKAVEAGIMTVWGLLTEGRLKIFSNCQKLLTELRSYQRDAKTGKPVKANDHHCDALRYVLHTHHAKQKVFYNQAQYDSLHGPSDDDIRVFTPKSSDSWQLG